MDVHHDNFQDLSEEESDLDQLLNAIEEGDLNEVIRLIEADNTLLNPLMDCEASTTPLIMACENSQLDIILYLLEMGADPNQRSGDEHTALIATIEFGKNKEIILKILDALIEHGADVNAKDKYSGTPLSRACLSRKSHPDLLDFLIEKGADMDVTLGNKGSNLLMYSCEFGRIEAVKFLLTKGFDLYTTNSNGDTTLIVASREGHIDMVRFLLENGLDINEKNNHGNNALMIANSNDHTNIAYLLLNSMTSEAREEFANQNKNNLVLFNSFKASLQENATELKNKLLEASKTGELSEVITLLKCGAYIDATDENKKTPLMWACQNEHPDIVAYLLENKADTELKDKKGTTAIMFAAQRNRSTIILEALINNDADINAIDNHGDNALLHTCKNCNTITAKWLINNGTDINAANKHGDTALALACGNGYTGFVKWLINNGADINVTDHLGTNSALQRASMHSRTHIVAFLLQNLHGMYKTNNHIYRALSAAQSSDTACLLLNWMTPEEREVFATQNEVHSKDVKDFKESLQKNAREVYIEMSGNTTVEVLSDNSILGILPPEIVDYIIRLEVQLKIKEKFKDIWYRFSVFEHMNAVEEFRANHITGSMPIFPVLFFKYNKRKAEGNPGNPTTEQNMEVDKSLKTIIYSTIPRI